MQVWGSGTGDSGEHALKGRWISAIVVSKVKPLLRTQLQSVSDNGVVSVSLHSHRDCRISPPQFDALFNTAPGARCLVFSLHVNCKSTPKSSATRKLTQSGGRCRSSRKTGISVTCQSMNPARINLPKTRLYRQLVEAWGFYCATDAGSIVRCSTQFQNSSLFNAHRRFGPHWAR